MNTDLKGRIVKLADISYLILHEDDESPEWLRIKALGPRPTVYRMRRAELMERLGAPVSGTAGNIALSTAQRPRAQSMLNRV